MSAVTQFCLLALAISIALSAVRLLIGKTLADRIVALDSVLVMIASGVAIYSVRIGSEVYLKLLFVAALMGFISTVAVARFIERQRP